MDQRRARRDRLHRTWHGAGRSVVLRNRMTDATPTPLLLDAVSVLVRFEPGRAWVMDIQVIALREAPGLALAKRSNARTR